MRNRLNGPLGFALLLTACLANPAHGDGPPMPLLANGSFEQEGQASPPHWQLENGAAWVKHQAHRGKYFLRATSVTALRACQSDPVTLQPNIDYRLEGWIRSADGEARLGLDLLDAGGRVVRSIEAPRVDKVSEWQYVAVQFKADAPQVRVWFVATGTCDLDDVSIGPAAIGYLGNRDVQPDAKGRIGLWGEEKEASVAAGNRGGAHRSDPEVRRRQLPSLLVESSADWYAISSVNYPLPAFTDRIQLSAWARSEGAASAQILACWMDDMQRVVRVDAGPQVRGTDWQKITLDVETPPTGESSAVAEREKAGKPHTLRLVALARGGRVWFDDFELLEMPSQRPIMQALVNQVGYELDGPKSAVLATNFFPTDGTTLKVQLIDTGGKIALEKDVACSGRIYGGTRDDWGWYFWRCDFSELAQPGTYRVVGVGGGANGQSFPFVVERGAVLNQTAATAVDFFFVQRCGFEVPGWHKACHLDDARLADGTHRDVTGGWHSAGDYNKPMWQFGDSRRQLRAGDFVRRAAATVRALRPRQVRPGRCAGRSLVGGQISGQDAKSGRWFDVRRRAARTRPHVDELEGSG